MDVLFQFLLLSEYMTLKWGKRYDQRNKFSIWIWESQIAHTTESEHNNNMNNNNKYP